ncbi:MAG: response regulator [Pseudomonadota bacterium]
MKLLLLEDDDLLAATLAESLKDNGYLVDVAASIQAAESFMATEEYALVILDIGLPDGSGLELLSQWRKQKHATPILRLVPAFERGEATASRRLQHSIALEMVLVAVILLITAVLTTVTSPNG